MGKADLSRTGKERLGGERSGLAVQARADTEWPGMTVKAGPSRLGLACQGQGR